MVIVKAGDDSNGRDWNTLLDTKHGGGSGRTTAVRNGYKTEASILHYWQD